MKIQDLKEQDTSKKILGLIKDLDKKSIELLWEGFLYSPQADITNDRIDALKLYNELKLIIELSEQHS